jgi:hypothetical protein
MKLSINKFKFMFKKHSPEILVITGVVGVVTSAVMACKATTKVNSIIEKKEEIMDIIHETAKRLEDGETLQTVDGKDYTMETIKKDTTIVYIQTGLKLVKLYAPSVILGTLSIVSILASNNILRKRNVALTAAYATLDKGFKEYRNRVIDRFGEKVDHQIRHNLKDVEVEETIIDENGKEKKVKKTIEVADGPVHSPYVKVFDECNANWEKSSEHNMFFLKSCESFANDKLKAKGRLFLNEVYEMIGFEPTKAGQAVGWVYSDDPKHTGANYVDFGICDIYTCTPAEAERKTAFMNGYERSIILDFNVDGNVWESM